MLLFPFPFVRRVMKKKSELQARRFTWTRFGGTMALTLIPLFAWNLGVSFRTWFDPNYYPPVERALHLCGFVTAIGAWVSMFIKQPFLRRLGMVSIPIYAFNVGYNFERQEYLIMLARIPVNRLWQRNKEITAEVKAENANNEHQQK